MGEQRGRGMGKVRRRGMGVERGGRELSAILRR